MGKQVENSFAALIVQVIMTIVLCVGMMSTSLIGLASESRTFAAEVTAGYNTLTNDYLRSFKVLRMEAEQKIAEDLSFDEMQAWLVSRNDTFTDAVGADIFDGFAFTYKGGYVHSWNYGDYSQYDPASRPWWQVAQEADGRVAIVAPYVTYLSNTDYIEQYDLLRMSVVQRYSDDISFDYDIDVTEINNLIANRKTIYSGSAAFLFNSDGYVLSSSDPNYYGHNVNVTDTTMTESMRDTLQNDSAGLFGLSLRDVDGQMRVVYHETDDSGMSMYLLIPFGEVFLRNFLFVLLLAIVLICVEVLFYRRIGAHMQTLEETQANLKDALGQAESASKAKGAFMSRISHEIRTPLNAIIGYLEIAKDEPENPDKTNDCLEKSQLASRHLLSIINDVLDISSIESGRMKLAYDAFDIKQMVGALTALFYSQATDKGVDFQVRTGALETEHLVGDELRVRQILLNLLSNAVKFTPSGGKVILEIEQVGKRDDAIHLRFAVRDTGIGMSKEYLSHVFEPFEQESSSTARNYGGTGLGLSISANLVRMMGGTIEVASVQGEGTTFTVLLAFGIANESDDRRLSVEGFSHVKVLVVDDEEDTCEYVHKLLERCGVACDMVNSGKKAVRRVESRMQSNHPYDLCIVDWNMEGMDGLETARAIRRIAKKDLPIIIATAYDYSSIVDEAREAGVDKIISKPLFQSTMMDLLVSTYGKYTPTDEPEEIEHDFSGMCLLLAEDNDMNREIALDILSKANIEVVPAVDGSQAVELFEQSEPNTFDAILMDVQMPVMDGYTATRAIRESEHPQGKTIPIIAMTANAFAEDVTAALSAGMNDHVAKPIDYSRLYDSLARLTRNRGE